MAKRKEFEPTSQPQWLTLEHPGYLGKLKEEKYALWNEQFGDGNWRLAWELANGEVLDFERVFWMVYVAGYTHHFRMNLDQANFLTQNYAFAYDKDKLSRPEAFNPYALYEKPNVSNQFHHVALNLALEWFLAMPFQGRRPIQVREGKPGTALEKQPEGYQWSPGRIATTRPELIPAINLEGIWWQKGTIEDLYQTAKVLQIRNQV